MTDRPRETVDPGNPGGDTAVTCLKLPLVDELAKARSIHPVLGLRGPPMRLILGVLLVVLAGESAGCHKKDSPAPQVPPDAVRQCPDAGGKAFGQECSVDCECASGVCGRFGDGTRACSQRCTDASQCPSGSRGKKCTKKEGVCRT